VAGFLDEQSTWVTTQHTAAQRQDGRDFTVLAEYAAARGGRIYAGSSRNWGADYKVGYIPGYIELLDLGLPGVGFSGRVPAVTEPSEARFDADSRAQAEVFDVRWQLRPAGMPGPPGAIRVASRGRHNLWHTETSGAVQLADSTPAIATRPAGVAAASLEFLRTDLGLDGRYPLLAFDEDEAGTPTVAPGHGVVGPAGRVVSTTADPGGADYATTVVAERPAIVVIKTSANPRWRAQVDGKPTPTDVVAPGLVAVRVPPGQHEVDVHFVGFPRLTRLALTVLGLAALAGLWRSDRQRA
jgi:hypothetical protein